MDRIILIVLISFLAKSGFSQSNPSFSTFTGKAYGVPKDELVKPFDPKMLDYRIMSEVSWEKINFQSDPCIGGIADLWLDDITYGIYLQSKMEISEEACYQFSLNTDDGSYLWINEDLVIDNSGDHKMTLKEQELSLDKGIYDIKIWYYQLHDLCGLEFNAIQLQDQAACIEEPKEMEIKESFTLSSSLVFESGSHQVKSSSHSEIMRIQALAKEQSVNQLDIIGHTDNIGSEIDNEKLSLRRAESLKTIFETHLENTNILINAIGKGELEPIASNATEQGRAENRRVQILLVKK